MISPVRGDHRRFQAETPLMALFKFAEPALTVSLGVRSNCVYTLLSRNELNGNFFKPASFTTSPQPAACAGSAVTGTPVESHRSRREVDRLAARQVKRFSNG